MKEEEINELMGKIESGKKAEEEIRERMELLEKENKKIVKKLNSDIEEYKNLSAIIKEENLLD
jgi:hypothetical protein